MTTAMQTFNNEDFGEIRTVLIDGEPWFVGKDVANALGYKDTKSAIIDHVPDKHRRVITTKDLQQTASNQDSGETPTIFADTAMGGIQRLTFINEAGLYKLVFASRLPKATEFSDWVCEEVLPTLRKTGKYEIQSTAPTPLADAVTDVRKTADAIQAEFIGVQRSIAFLKAVDIAEEIYDMPLNKLKELVPPAQHDTGFLNPTQIGERLGGIKPRVVNLMLAEAGLQYKVDKNWRLTEKGKGFGEEFPYTRNGHSGWQIKWNADVLNAFKVETAELLKGEISNDDSNADFQQ